MSAVHQLKRMVAATGHLFLTRHFATQVVDLESEHVLGLVLPDGCRLDRSAPPSKPKDGN